MPALADSLSLGQIAVDYVSFLAWFAAGGAVGFRNVVLRASTLASTPASPRARILDIGARRAAVVGLFGAALLMAHVLFTTLQTATVDRRAWSHVLVAKGAVAGSGLALSSVALVGFGLAARRLRAGWPLATAAVLAMSLRAAATGEWLRLVDPIHQLAASLWLGTLLLLVAVGLPAALDAELSGQERGRAVADMVEAFSPLALVAASGLALSGVVTAWRHLHYFAALWTTPYGWTLILKLCVVGAVVGLGAWNWRRVRPALGTEEAAHRLRRSATAELALSALVLAITAVLLSVPSPPKVPPL
jgi:putative copper export protein